MKNIVSCNAASKATMLSMGSLSCCLGQVSSQYLISMRWVVRHCLISKHHMIYLTEA